MSDHDTRLTELGKQLPWDKPADVRREAVRSSLLLAAAEHRDAPRSRWRTLGMAFGAGAAAAAVVSLVVARRGDVARTPQPATAAIASARIEASHDADVEREVVHDGSGHLAELVRVHAGSVQVASAHLGEHVQVATADARVDGDGAVDVEVERDQLRAITVRTGTATLKVRDQQVVILAAGQTWKASMVSAQLDLTPAGVAAPPAAIASGTAAAPASAAVPAAAAIPAAAAAPASVRTPAAAHGTTRDRTTEAAHVDAPPPQPSAAVEAQPQPAAVEAPAQPAPVEAPAQLAPVEASAQPAPVEAGAPHGRSATEQHFAAGYALLQQGKPADAARELGIAADGDGDLAADARYFQAIALTRAGRKTEAEAALVAFLDHAPASLRRGRAAVMLAKLIAERGDRESARRWFESALGDPDPAVVAAARAGIASL